MDLFLNILLNFDEMVFFIMNFIVNSIRNGYDFLWAVGDCYGLMT
jgi:hypothetical protein